MRAGIDTRNLPDIIVLSLPTDDGLVCGLKSINVGIGKHQADAYHPGGITAYFTCSVILCVSVSFCSLCCRIADGKWCS